MRNDNSREDTMVLAKAACQKARQIIKTGAAQIENNGFSRQQRESRVKAIEAIREHFKESESDFLNIDINKIARFVFEGHRYSKKYSIGNCSELSKSAFVYLLKRTDNVEVVEIVGGDHVFVIINRSSSSDLQHPDTWGDTSVICDPFTNKVFPAADYKTQLQAYSFGGSSEDNKLIPFDSKEHKFKILTSAREIHTLNGRVYLKEHI